MHAKIRSWYSWRYRIYLKPTIGVLDLLTKTGEGIRNATDMADGMQRTRDRPPRYFGPDRVLQPYSAARSAGQELLRRVDNGRFVRDFYITHYDMMEGSVLLVSHQHLLFFTSAPKLILQWSEPLSVITAIEGADDYVTLQLRSTPTNAHRVIRTAKEETMAVYNWLMEQIKEYALQTFS